MKIKTYLILCLFLATSHSFAGDDLTLTEAVNIAGRQRMLTQRMVKAYCQIGVGVTLEKSQSQLTGAVDLFEQQLSALENQFASNSDVALELMEVRNTWDAFRTSLTGSVKHSHAQQLADTSDKLLASSHRVVELLQDASGTEYARLVNISGRQRMLSQRAAKLYLLSAWGLDNPELQNALNQTSDEFAAALKELQSSNANTPTISRQLRDVNDQWVSFASTLNIEGSATFPLIVADASEKILQHFEEITFLYQTLSDQ